MDVLKKIELAMGGAPGTPRGLRYRAVARATMADLRVGDDVDFDHLGTVLSGTVYDIKQYPRLRIMARDQLGRGPYVFAVAAKDVVRVVRRRAGGKARFDPAQLQKGIKEELEHAATIRKVRRDPKLPVKKVAELIAKDHLKTQPHYYDRLAAVEVPRRGKGLRAPRLKLYLKSGKLRVYIVDSNATRKLYGDFTGGGHHRVYADFIPPNEVWLAEELFGVELKLYALHELNEYALMGSGMGYDEAHDNSTALEQTFRKGGRKGLDAALRKRLREAAAS